MNLHHQPSDGSELPRRQVSTAGPLATLGRL